MITPIIILCLLSLPLFVAYVASRFTGRKLAVRKYACWGLGIAFIFFFVGHIVKTDGMVDMLPEWVPLRLQLIYVTGLIELAIGGALFIPKYQKIAAKIAILVFIVFFPANVYAALNGVGLGGHQWGTEYLLIRTPLQVILIAWAYYLCVRTYSKPLNSGAAGGGN